MPLKQTMTPYVITKTRTTKGISGLTYNMKPTPDFCEDFVLGTYIDLTYKDFTYSDYKVTLTLQEIIKLIKKASKKLEKYR